jgi:hypothetical protein
MTWGITKLHTVSDGVQQVWTALSTWKPAPDDGSGWEPVFHPALHSGFVYAPGDAGSLLRFDRHSGILVDRLQPFDDEDPNRYVVSPVTVGPDGSVYYAVLRLDAVQPWSADAQEAWLVKFDPGNNASRVSFGELAPAAPVDDCYTTFAGMPLPWPPAPDAVPPTSVCGSQRPPSTPRRLWQRTEPSR